MMNTKKKENYRKQGRKYLDEMLKKYDVKSKFESRWSLFNRSGEFN